MEKTNTLLKDSINKISERYHSNTEMSIVMDSVKKEINDETYSYYYGVLKSLNERNLYNLYLEQVYIAKERYLDDNNGTILTKALKIINNPAFNSDKYQSLELLTRDICSKLINIYNNEQRNVSYSFDDYMNLCFAVEELDILISDYENIFSLCLKKSN